MLKTVCQSFFQQSSPRIYKVNKRLDFLGIEYLRRTKATPQCQVHFGLLEGVVTSLCQTFWMGIMGGRVIILLFSKVVKSLVYLCNEDIYVQGKKNTEVQKR